MQYRQVHLDFHTSNQIQGIGALFNKKQFQEALEEGHVDSITLFSKCHHGWSYHPSKVNEMHPGLSFDLLGAQIEAAHEMGIKTPVYLSAAIDEKYAVRHRGHLVRTSNEQTTRTPDFMRPGYHRICFNTPYLEILLAQIKEVCENYDVDGIFLDIVQVQPCYCEKCINDLFLRGKDPGDFKAVLELAEQVYHKYMKRVRETIDSVKPGLPVFHNGGHVRLGRRDLIAENSHLELESLPTGGWGYDHFPVTASYARSLGMEFLGMTGKFHLSWGDIGGFKHPNALRYETALSLANGAKCSIGDHMHPTGVMDMVTYKLIGVAYKELEEKEQYVDGAKNVADIAVFGVEAIENYYAEKDFCMEFSARVSIADAGCARILLEGKYLFNYVDAQDSLDGYKLLILPDNIVIDEPLRQKIKTFVDRGGRVLASGKSGIDAFGNLQLDFGCEWKGENSYRPDYCRLNFSIEDIGNSAYVIRQQGYLVDVKNGKIHGNRENSYFNRTKAHFSGHSHTPNNKDDVSPAIVEGNDGIYIGWNIFEDYGKWGSLTTKRIVCSMIDRLLTNPSIKTNLPAQGIITLMEKESQKIVHLLYASPVKRGENVEIIEDILPVFGTEVSVKWEGKINRVFLAPQELEIPYEIRDGYVRFAVEKLECHQMVIIE